MKKQIILFILIVIAVNCFSQIVFEKGYFIKENDERVECLIKNVDWKNNPSDFKYTFSENSEVQTADIHSVKEFGIDGSAMFLRASVEIDRSSEELNKLSSNRDPDFRKEELFLKVLVKGEASLFQFEEVNFKRFFYKTGDSVIKQLVYKSYLFNGYQIGQNNYYRQQLFQNFKCQEISENNYKTIRYDKKDLVRFFVKYNECKNSTYINFEEKQNKDLFNLTLRPGLDLNSLLIQNSYPNKIAIAAEFENKINFRLGLEAEIIMPFNNNKWGFIIEPTFQYFNSIQEFEGVGVEVNYKSVELPFGIRYYLFLNESSKVFMNASFVLDISSNSAVKFDSDSEFEIHSRNNYALGLGYKYNDRFCTEFRYQSSRDILSNYVYWDSDYKTLSLIIGYTIF